jgi:hypothetical protein
MESSATHFHAFKTLDCWQWKSTMMNWALMVVVAMAMAMIVVVVVI